MKIITVSMQKGGTGKTTTAFHLAWGLPGKKLVVDLDPQGSLSELFDCSDGKGSHNLLLNTDWRTLVTNELDGIKIIPSSLAGFGIDGSSDHSKLKEHSDSLYRQLNSFDGDWVILDCGPGQTFCTISAQLVADFILFPLSCRHSSLRALKDIQPFLKRNIPQTKWFIVPTMLEKRKTFHKKILELLKNSFGSRLLQAIPYNVAIEDIWDTHKPVWNTNNISHPAIKALIEMCEQVNQLKSAS